MPDIVTRHRIATTTTDAGGNTVPATWTTDPIGLADFAPGPTEDVVGAGRDGTEDAPSVYFEGRHPDIDKKDRLEVRGVVYTILGRPQVWDDGGTVVRLREVDG